MCDPSSNTDPVLINYFVRLGVEKRGEEYAKFVSTLAPAWEEDKRPVYGGFFWFKVG